MKNGRIMNKNMMMIAGADNPHAAFACARDIWLLRFAPLLLTVISLIRKAPFYRHAGCPSA